MLKVLLMLGALLVLGMMSGECAQSGRPDYMITVPNPGTVFVEEHVHNDTLITKLYDDGETVIDAVKIRGQYSVKSTMYVAVFRGVHATKVNEIRVYRRFNATGRYPQVMMIDNDGYLRAAPLPRNLTEIVPFDKFYKVTSSQVGSIEIDPTTMTFYLRCLDGKQKIIKMARLDSNEAVLKVA